jgi:hypothetical protein
MGNLATLLCACLFGIIARHATTFVYKHLWFTNKMSTSGAKRSQRITKKQKEFLVNYITENRDLLGGKEHSKNNIGYLFI